MVCESIRAPLLLFLGRAGSFLPDSLASSNVFTSQKRALVPSGMFKVRLVEPLHQRGKHIFNYFYRSGRTICLFNGQLGGEEVQSEPI